MDSVSCNQILELKRKAHAKGELWIMARMRVQLESKFGCQKIWKISSKMKFLRINIWRYQNDRETSGIIFLVGPSLQEMPEVTRRAYMLRMSMLVRVIRWPGWASLNFCSSGHFVWNDHHIEKFEKFEHSIDFPIVFLYTCGYAGAACLTHRCWGPFFE